MKNIFILFLGLAFLSACQSDKSPQKAKSSMELVTEEDSLYYALGAQFSSSLATSKLPLDFGQFRNGFLDCEQGQSYINEENVSYVTGYFRKRIRDLQTGMASEASVDSFSYAYGGNQFFTLNSYGLTPKKDAMFAGITDYMDIEVGKGPLSTNQINSIMARFRVMSEEAQKKKNAELAITNKKKGQAYIIQKATSRGVKSTGSGLYYKVMKEGRGTSPDAESAVTVHYEGRLIDGTVFDSSIERGEPATFVLNAVIKGWQEGLQLMKPGAKYQLYIPAALAYGDTGMPPKIGPGETLVFDVELLEVRDKGY